MITKPSGGKHLWLPQGPRNKYGHKLTEVKSEGERPKIAGEESERLLLEPKQRPSERSDKAPRSGGDEDHIGSTLLSKHVNRRTTPVVNYQPLSAESKG